EVQGLSVAFAGSAGKSVEVVSELSYTLRPGETLGVVGESGCGKTMTTLSVMGLLPHGAQVSGSIRFEGKELTALSSRQLQDYRGREIAMIFQEPMSAMNPVMKVGQQIAEVLQRHERLS